MKLSEMYHGMVVTCRTGRAGRTSVEWDGPWREEPLYILRDRRGKLLTVTIMGGAWAEGGERDFCEDEEDGDGTFVVEDWYLKVKGLTKG